MPTPHLANAAVSVADSPMRVASGPVLGLGPVPADVEGVPLPSATRAELDKARFAALVALVIAAVYYWDEWTAALLNSEAFKWVSDHF